MKCAFDMLLELYHDKSKSSRQEDVEARFLALLRSSLEYFLTITSKTQQGRKTNVVATNLRNVIFDTHFFCHLPYLQSGASYLSQGFEDNVLGSSPG